MSELRRLLSMETVSIGLILSELERGADTNKLSLDGVSAMHLAAGLGQEVISDLIQYGGDPNVRSREGLTPLHVAASYGDVETLTLLLYNGANANLQDEDGNRPLDLAIENGHPQCIEKLKIHTMLASVEDCTGYRYSCQNQDGCHSICSNQTLFDNSCIVHEALKTNYAKTITQEVYDYLAEGKNICFDVTSPTTPLIGFKKSCCKPCCNCGQISRSCPARDTSNSLTHEARRNCHSPQREFDDSVHLPHTATHRSTFTPQSPQRLCHGSIQPSHSPIRFSSPGPSCLNCSAQKLHDSSCVPHSPFHHQEHLRLNSTSPLGVSNLLSQPNSSHLPMCSNDELPHLSYSPQTMNFELTPSVDSHNRTNFGSSQRINGVPPYRSRPESYSPQRISHKSPRSPRLAQRVCHRFPQLSPSPNRFREEIDITSTQQVICEKSNNNFSVLPSIIKNGAHFPKTESKYFTSLYPNSGSNIDYSRVDATGDCPNLLANSFHQKSHHNTMSLPSSKKTDAKACNPGSDFKVHDNEKRPVNANVPSSSSSDQSVSSTLSRVAEYVLSCTDFSSQCNVDDTSQIVPMLSHTESLKEEKENISPCESVSKSLSSSSSDSFCTAENKSSSNSPDCTVNNGCSLSTHPSNVTLVRNSTSSSVGDACCSQKDSSQRWHPPTQMQTNVLDDSIMTSENSFRTVSKRNLFPSKLEKPVGKSDKKSAVHETCKTDFQKKKMELGHDLLPKVCNVVENSAMGLDDSLFSTVTVEEYLHTDPESGITLLEKWIPSECESSRGSIISSRRSLESLSSKVSQDSQATLIYDWKTLKQVSKVDSRETDHKRPMQSIHNGNEKDADEVNANDTVIPLRLKKLSNEELSQELQKFGEIPGPVIAATRQVYLKRLTSLESEPGLFRITKACPDYPNELRQALNGSFDWSSMADLEMKMAESFTNSQGRQWREGSAKSSFTYLLLDPRVTLNLPLRAKELGELETFKNFICAIFYIGKGKRARPYCHLYEAVSKMHHKICKKSDKVQHILDIWDCNLGVISLHCFQSVIPVEAYTREACMLDAIGMHKVTNVKRGDFYGIVSTWPQHQRKKLGVYLLLKAMKIFLADGERQICVPDLK